MYVCMYVRIYAYVTSRSLTLPPLTYLPTYLPTYRAISSRVHDLIIIIDERVPLATAHLELLEDCKKVCR